MHQISGTIEVLENGVRSRHPPLAPVLVDYPGRGSGTAYTVGHPEPLTLPPRLGVSGRSANLMVLSPDTLAFLDGLRRDIDRERVTESVIEPRAFFEALAPHCRPPRSGFDSIVELAEHEAHDT